LKIKEINDMSDGKLSEAQVYENLKRECEVVGQSHDLLMTGRFPGGAAQVLFQAQAYLKGLYAHLKAEADKRAPLELPKDKVSKPVEEAAVEPAKALAVDSTEPSKSA
jgi:hypothetical protein